MKADMILPRENSSYRSYAGCSLVKVVIECGAPGKVLLLTSNDSNIVVSFR
jgi:hypothetical protein